MLQVNRPKFYHRDISIILQVNDPAIHQINIYTHIDKSLIVLNLFDGEPV